MRFFLRRHLPRNPHQGANLEPQGLPVHRGDRGVVERRRGGRELGIQRRGAEIVGDEAGGDEQAPHSSSVKPQLLARQSMNSRVGIRVPAMSRLR